MADYKFREDDTEPIDFTVTITSDSELSTSDITSVVLYARKSGASSNHVDGSTVTVNSVSTSQDSDGTWTNDFDCTFDPDSAAAGGGNAFVDQGIYEVYTKVTWTDGDTTRHPASGNREWRIVGNFE